MTNAELNEKCAVFGVIGRDFEAARITFYGLFAQQHRGQESSGIVSSDGQRLYRYAAMGLVAQVYHEDAIVSLKGHSAIGHNRYSTSRSSTIDHAQPIISGEIALAHNGNLPSVAKLTDYLSANCIASEGWSDSRMITEAIGVSMRNGKNIEDAIREIFPMMTGVFSLVIQTKDKLIALRDSYGIRPLSVARLNGGFVVASETCAFSPIGATYLRDVEPGEMIVFDENEGMHSEIIAQGKQMLDVFEFVYFSRPDSVLAGKSVYQVRRNFGLELAMQARINADVVVPVPETALPVATAYSQATGIPLEFGLAKNRYIHRTFIQPEQHIREQGVKTKLSTIPEVLDGKRVIVIDDSIVRGTTSRQIVKMLFTAGAKEVHFLVSSPPVRYPDFYGIDTPCQNDLISARMSVHEVCEFLGATSLTFLKHDAMIRSVGLPEESLCTSCFTGVYPIDLRERANDVRNIAHLND